MPDGTNGITIKPSTWWNNLICVLSAYWTAFNSEISLEPFNAEPDPCHIKSSHFNIKQTSVNGYFASRHLCANPLRLLQIIFVRLGGFIWKAFTQAYTSGTILMWIGFARFLILVRSLPREQCYRFGIKRFIKTGRGALLITIVVVRGGLRCSRNTVRWIADGLVVRQSLLYWRA